MATPQVSKELIRQAFQEKKIGFQKTTTGQQPTVAGVTNSFFVVSCAEATIQPLALSHLLIALSTRRKLPLSRPPVLLLLPETIIYITTIIKDNNLLIGAPLVTMILLGISWPPFLLEEIALKPSREFFVSSNTKGITVMDHSTTTHPLTITMLNTTRTYSSGNNNCQRPDPNTLFCLPLPGPLQRGRHWLEALILKHLLTTWDLITQTKLPTLKRNIITLSQAWGHTSKHTGQQRKHSLLC